MNSNKQLIIKQFNMKKAKRNLAAVPLIVAVIVMGFSSCTKHDQVLNTSPTPVLNTDTLYAAQGTGTLQPILGSAWDGTIESIWDNAKKLTVHAVVPDPGNGAFPGGFIGASTDVTMRSLYDAENIYFLVEWNCAQKNVRSAQWYFNPATHRWAQESGNPVIDANGIITRKPFIQDQFVMMFDIANSTPAFTTHSCYGACHVISGSGAEAAMWTNGPTEKLDCWRARMLQVVNVNQANDTYIDWGNGLNNKNQVHNDPMLNPPPASPPTGPAATGDGGFNNVTKGLTYKMYSHIHCIRNGISITAMIVPNVTLDVVVCGKQ